MIISYLLCSSFCLCLGGTFISDQLIVTTVLHGQSNFNFIQGKAISISSKSLQKVHLSSLSFESSFSCLAKSYSDCRVYPVFFVIIQPCKVVVFNDCMSKGFRCVGSQPVMFSKVSFLITIPNHCLEEVFIEYKVNLGEFQSHLEAFDCSIDHQSCIHCTSLHR